MSNQSPVPPKAAQKKSHSHSILTAIFSGLLVFVILAGLLEGAFRLDIGESVFPLRSVGNYHTQFEIKWFKLEDYVKKNGGVDVILLGNSMVNTGIDPKIVAARYGELTGEDVRIFNFGVEGLTVEPLSDLAKILMDKYHPRVIILYTEMRDYITGNGNQTTSDFLSNAWIQQQLGHSSVEGFLETNSLALQRVLPLRFWSQPDFIDDYLFEIKRNNDTSKQGYEPEKKVGTDITTPPSQDDPDEAANFALFKDFKIDPGRQADLENILSFTREGTVVIVSEMPAYPTFYAYIDDPSVRETYLKDIQTIVEGSGGVFVPAISYDLIPLSGRADNHHLNKEGASIYSSLLAEQLAALCAEQEICLMPGVEEAQP
jgi:hypothetical protein